MRIPILLSSLLLSLAAAQGSTSNSSIFVYNGDDHTEFVFALQADKASGDLYFHLSSPAGNAWVGVGVGSEMDGALMFIAYPDGSGKGVTISPRTATGHTEPTYQSNIVVEKQSGNRLTGANTVSGDGDNKIIVADGVCRGCATCAEGDQQGSIDFTSTAQPFIFAVGSPFPPLASDSQSAGLNEHMFVGHFTMDMTAATQQSGGSVPLGPYTARKSATAATATQFTNDPAPHIHGLVMCIVFILLLPLGSLILRVWNKVKGHAIVQVIALVLFCMATAGGIVVSTRYNRSKHFNSAHQIIGILLLLALFTQLVLGILHHRVFKKEQRKTIRGWIHLYLGPAIIFFGLVNGGIGFAFAGNAFLAIPYVIIILMVTLLYSCVRFFAWRRGKRNRGIKEQQGPEGYQYPQFGHQPPPPGTQPYYGEPIIEGPPPYRQDVPLQSYGSSHSIPQVDMPAHEPRPMV